MIDDVFFELLVGFRIRWWAYIFIGGAAFILGNTLLCAIYGGVKLIKKFYSDRVALLWGFIVLGIITSVYYWSSLEIDKQLLLLDQNGYSLALSRFEGFKVSASWVQWVVWPVSVVITAYNSRKYVHTQRDVFFSKFSLLEGLIYNVIITYMIFMGALKWAAALVSIGIMVSEPLTPIKVLHEDGLYGLDPARDIISDFIIIALIISVLPLLVFVRERSQSYGRIYTFGVYIGVAVSILVIVFLLPGFNRAIEELRQGSLQEVTNQIVQLDASDNFEATRLAYTRYQVISGLPKTLPLPDWLKLLGSSRVLLFGLQLYGILQPIFMLPKLPSIGERMAERLLK